MRKFGRVLGFGVVALLIFFPSSRVSGQETGRAATDTAPKNEEAPQVTLEQLNAMKSEWEEVREQQIQMIQEKEAQFEKLKEDLFKKVRAAEETPASAAKEAVPPAPPVNETVMKEDGKTQIETLLLQQKEQVLAAREQALAAKESALMQRVVAAENIAGTPASRGPEDLSEAKKELERQKTALAAERQKFFQEMNRQKEKMLALQSSLDAQAKKIQEDLARFEREHPAAAR